MQSDYNVTFTDTRGVETSLYSGAFPDKNLTARLVAERLILATGVTGTLTYSERDLQRRVYYQYGREVKLMDSYAREQLAALPKETHQ